MTSKRNAGNEVSGTSAKVFTSQTKRTCRARIVRRARLVALGHEAASLQARLIIVCALVRTARQLDLRPFNFLVRNGVQDVRDAAEASAALVVGADDRPRRMFAVRRLQHRVAGA